MQKNNKYNFLSANPKSTVANSTFYINQNLKREFWIVTLFFALIFCICCVASSYFPSGFIALIAFCAYFLYLIARKPIFLLKYFAFVFTAVVNLVGCFYAEYFDLYLSELQCFATFYGSLPLLVLAWWIFFQTLLLFDLCFGWENDQQVKESSNYPENKYMHFANIVMLVLMIVMFIRVLPNPSFLLGVNRFKYDSMFMIGIWQTFDSWLASLIVIPCLSIRKHRSKIGIATVCLYLLYLFWTGTKFGEFFAVLCLAVIAFYDKFLSMSLIRLRQVLIIVLSALLILVAFTSFAFSFTSTKSTEDFYSDRLAQQGQLWWYTYGNSNTLHASEFTDEIEALSNRKAISESVGENHGIYKIMYFSTPQSIIDAKLARGGRYTEAGFASAYYYFGEIGVIVFSLTMALIIAVIQNAMLRAFYKTNLIASIFLVRCWNLSRVSLSMFLFSQWLSTTSLAMLAFLFLRYLMHKSRHNKTHLVNSRSHAPCLTQTNTNNQNS